MASTRIISGQTDLPGHGRVLWNAKQHLLANGSPHMTLLLDATLTNGNRLSDEGRALLIEVERLTA